MAWSNAVLTTQGLALQAKLVAGTQLTITKAQTGSGTVTPSALPSQTAVTSPQQTLTFRPVTYPQSGTAAIPAYLRNDSLTTGYTVTQLGVFAQDPDEGEILYWIAQADTGTGVEIPSNTEMPGFTAEWTLYLTYGNADTVSVTVNPANSISQTQAQTMINTALSNATFNTSQITAGVLPVGRGGTGNNSVDSTPTANSTKMVTSGGIYTALNTKQSKITYGTGAPSGGSNGDIYIQYS